MSLFNTTKKILIFAMLLSPTIQPLWGQQLRGLNILMIEDSIRTIRLTAVSMHSSHSYFDEKGRMDIHFSYEMELNLKGNYTCPAKGRTDVRFLPTDIDGIYKVEEMSFLKRSGVSDVGYPAAPDWSFKGYSGDTTLLPVRVYNYYRQHAPAYKVYEPEQLDEQPYFTFNGSKLDFKEYISERLKRESVFTDNLCGTVTFSFVIHPYGWVLDFQVDEISLKPKNEFIRINGDTDIGFAQQINIFFCGLNYTVVKYGFYTHSPNDYWTPGKIKGEAVVSKQHLTFEFK